MNRLSRLIPVALMLGVASCADTTAPPGVHAPDTQPHHLRWNRTSGPVTFAASAGGPAGELALAETPRVLLSGADGDSVALQTYHASFWAKRGERRFIEINYVNVLSSTEYPFLRLSIADPVRHPNGQAIAYGDSVLITVAVDPVELVVHLEPSGIQFGRADPTTLRLWYGGAEGDLNGDGVVDEQDATIEKNLLGLWYQENILAPWQEINSAKSETEKWISSALEHFSGYAVSW